MSSESDDAPSTEVSGGDFKELARLRSEVDDLRWEKQRLLAELEEARHPRSKLLWRAKKLWHDAWHAYYVLRWKFLHERDPSNRLKPRNDHRPYAVRVLHAPQAQRRRVLHIIGNFYTGGSARLIVDLVENLGHEYEQRVLVRSLPPSPAYSGVDLVHIERLKSPRPVLREIQRFKPDLVHIHMLGHQLDEYGRTDWSWYHQAFKAVEESGVPAIENINIPVEPYISPAVRCYIYVSESVRERFARGDAWNETVYPGSDLDFFARGADLQHPDDVIGMVYRLQPDKLDEHSIEPFIEVVRRRPQTKVVIVGGGEYLKLYQKRVATEGLGDAFTFTGYVAYGELPTWIARMSLFVAPVHTESFGQVSPFAMGMSLPVVGYDVGALREITNAPELLARPGDVSGLAEIIVSLLDDREQRLAIGGTNASRARTLFSVEAMVERYREVYSEVLGSRRGQVHRIPRTSARVTQTGKAPAVSVVMAVRNGERFLNEAVDSILAQTFDDFEFIVVDDASQDSTLRLLQEYPDVRLRIVRNEVHMGLSASLNRGIRMARGRYIARMDADDVSYPERFARQVQLLDARPDLGLVGSWYSIIDQSGSETGRRWVPHDHHGIAWMLQFCSAFAHSAVMIRRRVLDSVGLYDETLTYAMDYELWRRVAEKSRTANVMEFLLKWRISPESMTSRLGDRTERFERVRDELAARLGWDSDPVTNERKTALLTGFVSGSPVDATVEEARWTARTLEELSDAYCERESLDQDDQRELRSSVKRQIARCMFWMGHRYPDLHGYRYAARLFLEGARLDPGVVLSSEGATLLAKLTLGGRVTVAAVRSLRGGPDSIPSKRQPV